MNFNPAYIMVWVAENKGWLLAILPLVIVIIFLRLVNPR